MGGCICSHNFYDDTKPFAKPSANPSTKPSAKASIKAFANLCEPPQLPPSALAVRPLTIAPS